MEVAFAAAAPLSFHTIFSALMVADVQVCESSNERDR